MPLDTRLPYRVGSRALIPLPVHTIVEQHFTQWAQVAVIFDKILKEEQVYVIRRNSVRRVRDLSDIHTTPKTVLILGDISLPGEYQKWLKAITRLDTVLATFGRSDILIEIIDSQAVDGSKVSPLTSDISQLWDGFRPTLLHAIELRAWISLDVVTRQLGTTHPTKKPTICITASDTNDPAWWNEILPYLRKCLPIDVDLDLFFLADLGLTTGNEEKDGICINEDDYPDDVHIGASMGVSSDYSASIGVGIQLRDIDGKETRLALTNFHNVMRHEGITKKNEEIGPQHEVVMNGLVHVYSPSDIDRTLLLKRTKANLAKLSAGRKDNALAKERINHIEKLLKSIDTDKDARLLGTLFAASGLRSKPNTTYTMEEAASWSRVRDTNAETYQASGKERVEPNLHEKIDGSLLGFGLNWALIDISPPRRMTSTVPWPGVGVHIPETATIEKFGAIQPNMSYKVAKYGRTLKWTTGSIAKVASLLNIGDAYPKIVLAHGIHGNLRRGDFLEPGDEGSVVLLNEDDIHSTVLGLGYATNMVRGVSYMMPIDLVIKDIENVTGFRVTRPVFSGEVQGEDIPDTP